MTTPRPHAELAARQSVADELRLAARNAALAGINGWGNLCSDAADTIDNLRTQLAEAQRERDKAIDLLETMFSEYENGTACYEDPEDCSGFVGYAFKMDDLDFNACCDLLNRTRPRTAIDAAKGEPS